MVKLIFYCVLLFNFIQSGISVNILMATSIASPSHHLWNRIIAFSLVEKGYNVTMLTSDKDFIPTPKNYTLIQMEGIYETLRGKYNLNDMVNNNALVMMKILQVSAIEQCIQYYDTIGLKKLINYPKEFRFDLIILDVTLGPCLVPLIERFNRPPTIATTAFLLPQFISYNFGSHLHPAYIPWYGFAYTNQMTFMQRVWNFVFYYLDLLLRNYYEYKVQEKAIREKLGGNMSSWDELERHISLVLPNIDPILNYPQPLTPNIIPVGGLQARPSKKLPNDLQVLLDNAKNGFILFTLGTSIRSDKLDQTKREALLSAFSKMPELIVWKFESDIKNLPKNVIVRKWLPQNDILGHPNIKLFISHGGTLGSQEAMYHGVPLVVMPFLLDQFINAKMIIKKKIGVEMDFYRITADYVTGKVREVLDNPTYHQNVKKISQRFRDQPQSPMERAIFWIEYVLRHGNVDFLNTPARDMPFYVSSSIDVILFLILSLTLTFFILYKLTQIFLNSFKNKLKND